MGNVSRKGYLRIAYKSKAIQIHRLIWFFQTGEWPPAQIDHINGNKADNRWSNLRLATNSQNKMNSEVRRDSVLKVKGVTIDRRMRSKPYRAHVTVDGVRRWLGYFGSVDEALAARAKAGQQLHGPFARESCL
jgi:hypothetical protein